MGKKSKKKLLAKALRPPEQVGQNLGGWSRWAEIGFEVLLLVAVVVYALMVWWPTRYLPYHWEGASFVAYGARDLLSRGFSPMNLEALRSAHPPLVMAMLALAWKWWGEMRLVTHQVMLPWLPMLMMGTYWLGKRVDSRLVGVIACFLVGMMPVAVGAYGGLSIDLVVAAVATVAVALYVGGHEKKGVILLSLAVWMKTMAVWLVVVMAGWSYVNGKLDRKQIYKLLVPVLWWIAWLIYHQRITGWWLNPPEQPLMWPENLVQLVTYGVYVGRTVLGSHWRWLLTIPTMGAILWLAYKRSDWSKQVKKGLVLWLGVAVVMVVVSVRGNFGEEASLMIMPLLVVGALVITKEALVKSEIYDGQKGLIVVGAMVSLLWLSAWQPNISPATDYDFERRADLSYQDLIMVNRQAAAFLEVNFPDVKVYGAYPEGFYLTDPLYGYVTQGFNVEVCSEFEVTDEEDAVVWLHPYHPSQIDCRLIFDQTELEPIERFESNGMWVELYGRTATASAKLSGE